MILVKRLILASKSPRRKELLGKIIKNFSVSPSFFNEFLIDVVEPPKYVKILSFFKAMQIARSSPNNWVIGADTIVTVDNIILGKPLNKCNSFLMLKLLSEKIHKVYTGYTLVCSNKNMIKVRTISTKVIFKKISLKELKRYVVSSEALDRSGGYAIQNIGSFMIREIKGSYCNVIGLPICEIIEDLVKMSIFVDK